MLGLQMGMKHMLCRAFYDRIDVYLPHTWIFLLCVKFVGLKSCRQSYLSYFHLKYAATHTWIFLLCVKFVGLKSCRQSYLSYFHLKYAATHTWIFLLCVKFVPKFTKKAYQKAEFYISRRSRYMYSILIQA